MRTAFLVLLGILVLLAMSSSTEALWHRKKTGGKPKEHSKIYKWFHRNDKKKEEEKRRKEAAKKAETKKPEPSKVGSKVEHAPTGVQKPVPPKSPDVQSLPGRNSPKGGMGYLQSIGGGNSGDANKKEKELAKKNMQKQHKYN